MKTKTANQAIREFLDSIKPKKSDNCPTCGSKNISVIGVCYECGEKWEVSDE